jgi:hypothetical protein
METTVMISPELMEAARVVALTALEGLGIALLVIAAFGVFALVVSLCAAAAEGNDDDII